MKKWLADNVVCAEIRLPSFPDVVNSSNDSCACQMYEYLIRANSVTWASSVRFPWGALLISICSTLYRLPQMHTKPIEARAHTHTHRYRDRAGAHMFMFTLVMDVQVCARSLKVHRPVVGVYVRGVTWTRSRDTSVVKCPSVSASWSFGLLHHHRNAGLLLGPSGAVGVVGSSGSPISALPHWSPSCSNSLDRLARTPLGGDRPLCQQGEWRVER